MKSPMPSSSPSDLKTRPARAPRRRAAQRALTRHLRLSRPLARAAELIEPLYGRGGREDEDDVEQRQLDQRGERGLGGRAARRAASERMTRERRCAPHTSAGVTRTRRKARRRGGAERARLPRERYEEPRRERGQRGRIQPSQRREACLRIGPVHDDRRRQRKVPSEQQRGRGVEWRVPRLARAYQQQDGTSREQPADPHRVQRVEAAQPAGDVQREQHGEER
eukprot:3810399-Prymnesium_polylepis.1